MGSSESASAQAAQPAANAVRSSGLKPKKDQQLIQECPTDLSWKHILVGGGKSQPKKFRVPDYLDLVAKIGSGAYGYVASFRDKRVKTEPPKIVAIKLIADAFADVVDGKRILREIKLMRQMDHPCILNIEDMLPPERRAFDDIYMVMPIMELDLHGVIYSKQALTSEHYSFFCYQILLGLAYMHSARVVHRDLKPANILANNDCSLKICDFGLSRVLDDPSAHGALPGTLEGGDEGHDLTDYVVTRWYRAPEVILMESHYDVNIDVWAVGCILVEMFNRKPVFPGSSSGDQVRKIVNVLGTPRPEDLQWLPPRSVGDKFVKKLGEVPRRAWNEVAPKADAASVQLLDACFAFDPAKRTSARAALELPYFDKDRDSADLQAAVRNEGPIDWSFDHFEPTKDLLQQYIFEEIAEFHPIIKSG